MDKLLYVPNPLLRQKADKIQSVGIKEKEIAKKMMQIMIKAPGVGLAANQIGILKQIVTIFFVDQETKKETQYTLFNPKIVSYSQEKKHILIVDDDTRICDLLEKFLSKNGYLVSAVHSAEQARQILAGLEFDLPTRQGL